MADQQRLASTPRRILLPKPATIGAPTQAPTDHFKVSKRRKVWVACERCRKRKIKCDGSRLSCRACITANAKCEYDAPEPAAVRESHRPVADQDLQTVYDALHEMTEPDAIELLKTIRSNPTVGTVIAMPRDDRSSATPGHDVYRLRPTKLPVSLWTKVTVDDEFLTHLLALFWTWDNALTRVIHREMFTRELCDRSNALTNLTGSKQTCFCSEFLVNSILAVSAIYSLEHDWRRTSVVRGRAFADEALRLETQEQGVSIPYLQGLAMLAVYKYVFEDIDSAKALAEKLFRRLAATEWSNACQLPHDKVLDSYPRETQAALSYISIGFYCLDAKLSLVFGHKMTVKKPPSLASSTSIQGQSLFSNVQDDLWFPYPDSPSQRLSYSKESLDAECEFAELTEAAHFLIESNRTCPVPDYNGVKDLCEQIFHAKHHHEEKLKGGRYQLPIHIFLSVSYHTLVIKVLEPFVRFSFLDFNGGYTASSLSLYCSDAIVSALWNYSTAFGMRHEYWLLQVCQVATTATLSQPQPLSIQQGTFVRACQLLHDIGERLPRANVMLSQLLGIVTRDRVDVPDDARKLMGSGQVKASHVCVKGVRVVRGVERDVVMPGEIQDIIFAGDILRTSELSPQL